MSAKKYLVHYLVEEQEEVIAFSAEEAADVTIEEYGPQTKIVSVTPVEEETDPDEPPDDYENDEDEDDGYGHGI